MADGERCYQILRGRLYQRLPLLALPLGLLEWREGGAPGTDGVFFYAPEAWLHAAVKTPGDAEKVLLHSVLHAMLGHPWLPRRNRDAARWSLACDMSAELLRLRLLGLPLESTAGRAFYACKNGTAFSAAAVYDQLGPDFPVRAEELTAAFQRDSHAFWEKTTIQRQANAGSGEGEGLPALWKRQGERLRPYMQPERPKIGSGSARQRLSVQDIPENQTRFAALLQEFSVVRENRHVSDADFAYSWYAYGMEHYDGMPLIEPLEYSEERKLRELVIVLDTSASCSRGLTAWFLGAVHAILCRERLFFERFRLHILQCDCEVQQDTLLTDLDEFQWYMEHLALYGGGGTDFRPAFAYVDRLVAQGELPQLGGVLYFTDGYGVFPAEAPEYPAAFVMLQYRYDDINIPRWAQTLVLDADKPGRDEGWI